MQSIDQEGKTLEEALEKALSALKRKQDEVEYEVLDEGSKGVLGVGARPILLRVRAKEIPELAQTKEIVSKFFNDLGLSFSEIIVSPDQNSMIKIDIETDDSALLIGKHGKTLESFQLIINQILHETKYKYSIDISNYREKQNDKLVDLVKKMAHRIVKSRQRVVLKPMTAFDRRIVHETIKDFPDLTTQSIGTDPDRRVVISHVNPAVQNVRRNSGGGNYRQGGGGGYNRGGGNYGDRQPREGGYNRGGGNYGDRQPREGGYNREGGNYGDRQPREGGYNQGGGNYGDRQPREGGYNQGGGGGYNRGGGNYRQGGGGGYNRGGGNYRQGGGGGYNRGGSNSPSSDKI